MTFLNCVLLQVVIDGLQQKGHNISMKDSASCVVQGILKQESYIYANSDYRKYGEPDGYWWKRNMLLV